jgi:hypothetical protein
MNTLERYHIYKNKKTYGNILNDTYSEAENPIFEVIHKYKVIDGSTYIHTHPPTCTFTATRFTSGPPHRYTHSCKYLPFPFHPA